MMKIIDNHKQIKISWIDEKVKKESTELRGKVKNGEKQLAQFSQKVKDKYESTEKEMNYQKEKVRTIIKHIVINGRRSMIYQLNH